MATIRSSLPHEDRTASQPRADGIEPVILSNIREINPAVRLLRLSARDPQHTIKVRRPLTDYIIHEGLKAGGFTITSTPFEAQTRRDSPPFLELAIQKSSNPLAQWLWRPEADILGSQLMVRVGGSFTWPPQGLYAEKIERLVLVAGGVGIKYGWNWGCGSRPKEIHFLYGTKAGSSDPDPQSILFLPRLLDLVAAIDQPINITLSLYLTDLGHSDQGMLEHGKLPNRTFGRRIAETDLAGALDGWKERLPGGEGRHRTVCYVCGPQKMTDEFVGFLAKQDGMGPERVLCEKW
ncbi:hypothetical protein LTR86_002149 [Recurvomyces mirabilis]|nr:hypothetical protein LTR86_002149 [Recurvomyces mirabilis]